MVYDVFSFFNELDILEIRLNILNDYVDKFVIVEANDTFSGKSKPLYYKENETRFEKWHNKIIHHVMTDYPNDSEIYQKALISPNVGDGAENWIREFYQKESVIRPLSECDDNDIVFVSDVDEIWNPKIEFSIQDGIVFRPIQTAYPFYLNNRSNQFIGHWTGTRVSNYKTLKHYGPNHFRTEREAPSVPIQNGGWHFSWTNTKDKFEAFVSDDVTGRWNTINGEKTWIDESELPEYIIENKDQLKERRLML